MKIIEIIGVYIGKLNNIENKMFNFSESFEMEKHNDEFLINQVANNNKIDNKKLIIGKNGAGKTSLLLAMDISKSLKMHHIDVIVFVEKDNKIYSIYSSDEQTYLTDKISQSITHNEPIVDMTNGKRNLFSNKLGNNNLTLDNHILYFEKPIKTLSEESDEDGFLKIINLSGDIKSLDSKSEIELVDRIDNYKKELSKEIPLPETYEITIDFHSKVLKSHRDKVNKNITESLFDEGTPPFRHNATKKKKFNNLSNNYKLLLSWDYQVLYNILWEIYKSNPESLNELKGQISSLYEDFYIYNQRFSEVLIAVEPLFKERVINLQKMEIALDEEGNTVYKYNFDQLISYYEQVRSTIINTEKIELNNRHFVFSLPYDKVLAKSLKHLLSEESRFVIGDMFTDSLSISNNIQSSGMKKIIQLFLSIEAHILKNDIILIDEIDAFLYPDLSRRFINILYTFFENDKIKEKQIIVTSHSPFILSDFFKNQVINLEKLDKESRHFASNFNKILSEDFKLKGLVGEYATNLLKNIEEYPSNKQIFIINNISDPLIRGLYKEKYFKKISREEIDEMSIEDIKEVRKWIAQRMNDN